MTQGKKHIAYSWLGLGFTVLVMVMIRTGYVAEKPADDFKVTTWDSFGYYLYLPGLFIYKDLDRLDWVEGIDKEYRLTGGTFYQASVLPDGKKTGKYLTGVSMLQMPFFLMAHAWASSSDQYPADGFSYPYQLCIAWAPLVYTLLSLFLFRLVLIRFFDEKTTAIVLICSLLATNAVQYIAVEGGQSHGYIFPLYVLILYITMRWHDKPSVLWASIGGLILGLAVISRPTEFIMVFIPLLWNTGSKEAARQKWDQVKQYRNHVLVAALAALVIIFPQLLYWKHSTGGWIHNVGSKWYFLNPWFRVLFGWTKGWFIYTPITLFFVAGLFFMKKYPFRKSVLVFCLLNLWIITAWADWRYGGSYSTRALVQSYPVFSLAFGALLMRIPSGLWRNGFYVLLSYVLFVNVFQVWQYNENILHYNDMNRRYYQAIYLDSDPTPLDMSLLDTDEIPFRLKGLKEMARTELVLGSDVEIPASASWARVQIKTKVVSSFWDGQIIASLTGEQGKQIKEKLFRINHGLAIDGERNSYDFFIKIPENQHVLSLTISFHPSSISQAEGFNFDGNVIFY